MSNASRVPPIDESFSRYKLYHLQCLEAAVKDAKDARFTADGVSVREFREWLETCLNPIHECRTPAELDTALLAVGQELAQRKAQLSAFAGWDRKR